MRSVNTIKTILFTACMLFLGIQSNAQVTANVELANTTISNEAKAEAAVITNIQMRDLQANEPLLVVLDTRNREAFDLGSINRARFMGEDFSIEKIWMLNRENPIVIYGNDLDKNKEVSALLLDKGFKKVYFLYGTLGELSEQGIAVIGDVAKSDKKSTKKK